MLWKDKSCVHMPTNSFISKLQTNARTRRSLSGLMLGILSICSLSCGCSSQVHPASLAAAFGGLSVAPDAQGWQQLLDGCSKMSADDRRRQFQNFADSNAPHELRAKAAYVLARNLQMSPAPADAKEAITRYEQATALKPLADRCAWHIVECAGRTGDEKLTRSTLAKLAETSKDKDTRAAALYALGQSYMRTGEHDLARKSFKQIATIAPDCNYSLGSTYYLAEIELAPPPPPASTDATTSATTFTASDEAASDAIAAFKHYLQTSPDGHFALDIASQLKQLPQFHPGTAENNLLARVYYVNGRYKDALDAWKAADNNADWFKQASCLVGLGKTNDGKTALANGIKNHASDTQVADAAAMLCRFLNRDGAIAVWKGVLQHSPQCADAALYNLAIRAPNEGAALDYYRRLSSSYPTSAYAPESTWWVAWNRIKAGKSQDALAILRQAAGRYGDAKAEQRFLYWIGKLEERLGHKDAAKAAYAHTIEKAGWHYYGHRAAARLQALSGHHDPGWQTNGKRHVRWGDDTAVDWDFPEPPAELASKEGATIALLTELKQWDECLDLVEADKGLLRGFFLAKLKMPQEAINAAGKALHGPPQPSEPWQIAYPLLFARFIAGEAPNKNVDPLLVQALIREESRYNAQAISGSRALGLMQLMPATAYGVAKRLSIPLSGTADIHDPEKNMRLGIDYLSYTLRHFNNNALLAVASYNGGPNAVRSWSAHMPADADVFVENIPYKETREYVRKVFGSFWNYETIYSAADKPNGKTKAPGTGG
jgi:soluble lytic murein transglycosylase